MTTLAIMKSRIANEFRRDDLTNDIADAISTAIEAYKNERFGFNASGFVDAPAADDETDNPWMIEAERLIRSRAKLEIVVNVFRQPDDRLKTDLLQEVEDALNTLKRTVSNFATAAAGTLGAMKLRIAQEINRSDMGWQIANAISDAIAAYDDKRFFWNETRNFTFTTTQDQDRYTASDSGWANLGKVLKIDFAVVLIGDQPYSLKYQPPEWFEYGLTTASNIPYNYSWYDESVVLYPKPAAAWTLRIGCVEKVAPPSTDIETGNPWMTHAERLIRNRAKAELYTHVDDLADDAKALKFMTLADEACDQIDRRTTRLVLGGDNLVRPYC